MKLNITRDRDIKVNPAPNWLMLLGVIFVLLKVTEVTQVALWSWWLVLLPFYVGLAIIATIVVGVAGLAALVISGAYLIDGINKLYRKITRKKFK